MRKTLLILITLILAVMLGYTVYAGVLLGGFEIHSYSSIDEKSSNLDEIIAEYETKNLSEILSKQDSIDKAIVEYTEQKQQYEQLLNEKQTNLLEIDSANCYDVDYLWTKVGNYATGRGIDLEMDVSKSSLDQNKNEYTLTDLSFTAIGDYKNTLDFIDDLEKDERLEFEIRDFYMRREKIKYKDESGNEKERIVLKATFKVYGIAINKSTLTQITTNTTNNSVADSTAANF